MRAGTSCRRRLVLVLFAAGFVAFTPAGAAQDRDDRSFSAAAAATVKAAAANALNSAQDLTLVALDLIGIRYQWGGTTPDTGLDCSGLVRYVFQKVVGVTLPRTAKDMSRLGEQVSAPDLKPGDLVFFNTRRFAFSHVGIYLGDNQFVHAPRRGREVEVATLDSSFWQKRFSGARRMVGVLPVLLPAIVSEAVAAPLAAEPPTAPPPSAPLPTIPSTLSAPTADAFP